MIILAQHYTLLEGEVDLHQPYDAPVRIAEEERKRRLQAVIDNPLSPAAVKRIIEEVRHVDDKPGPALYNRIHNRHNRS